MPIRAEIVILPFFINLSFSLQLPLFLSSLTFLGNFSWHRVCGSRRQDCGQNQATADRKLIDYKGLYKNGSNKIIRMSL